MNNDIYNIDFTNSYPQVLKNNPDMFALANTLAIEYQKITNEIKNVAIYPRIKELDEPILDLLAIDLCVDWYDYEYPLEVKQSIIKDSIKMHNHLGTTYSVRIALNNIFPGTTIEEWFDYGGQAGFFRVVLDTTASPENINLEKILKTTESYKRKSAKLEQINYQNRVKVAVLAGGEFYKYSLFKTGVTITGTKPKRNKKFKSFLSKLNGATLLQDFISNTVLSGTKPDRSIKYKGVSNEIYLSTFFQGYRSEAVRAGTYPNRNVLFNCEKATTQASTAEMKGYTHNITMCGTSKCGTNNIRGGLK